MVIKNYVEIAGKKYAYTLTPIDDETSKIVCKDAKLEQDFLNEDIIMLLADIPNLIKAEQEYQQKQDSVIRFRVTGLEKMKIQEQVKNQGYTTISSFIKDKILD